MHKIKVGLIGFGYWGPNLLRNLCDHEGVEVLWVSDLLIDNLKKVIKLYPSIKTTLSYKEVLADASVDAVVLAVPTVLHFQLASDCLRAGKHVLVEKPMVETLAQAKKLSELSKRTKRIVHVDHPFVFSEAIKKIKQYVEERKLGKLYYYHSLRLNMGLIQRDINVIADLAPHDFSILDFLLNGEIPLSIAATGSVHVGKDQKELAHLHLEYRNGFVADVGLSWLSPLKVRQVMLVGERAMISFDDTEPSDKVKLYDKGVTIQRSKVTPFQPLYRSGDILIPKLLQTEALHNVVDSFVNSIQKSTKAPNDVVAGTRVIAMLEQAQRALKRR